MKVDRHTLPKTFFVDCPYCDHQCTATPPGGQLRPSEAIRLHDRMISHLRDNHHRAHRATNLSVQS